MNGTNVSSRTVTVTDPSNGNKTQTIQLTTITPPAKSALPTKEWPIDVNNCKVTINAVSGHKVSDLLAGDDIHLSGQPATEIIAWR